MTVKSDLELRADVERELEWEPSVDAARIGVAVQGGAVILTGEVPSFMQKWQAVKAAERVHGVRTVADEITVKLPSEHTRSDSEIAEAVVKTTDVKSKIEEALSRQAALEARSIQVETHNGTVVLTGHTHSRYEANAAARAAWSTPGITKVENRIAVLP
jgi:osmotically-inducible protein OsmY